jgi:hypothetical protein
LEKDKVALSGQTTERIVAMSDSPTMSELLGVDAPTNWGKWGPDEDRIVELRVQRPRWGARKIRAERTR